MSSRPRSADWNTCSRASGVGPDHSAGSLHALIAKLREVAQPVLNLPIVGSQVKPILEEIFASLDRLVPTHWGPAFHIESSMVGGPQLQSI